MTQANYEQLRNRVSTGDVILFKKGKLSLFRLLIQIVTASRYYHAGIALWITDDSTRQQRLMLVESVAGGRRLVSLSGAEFKEADVYKSPTRNKSTLISSLLKRTGTVGYGYLDLFVIGIKELFGVKSKYDMRGEVCSEMVAKELNRVGIRKKMQEVISPARLAKELVERGSSVKFCLIK